MDFHGISLVISMDSNGIFSLVIAHWISMVFNGGMKSGSHGMSFLDNEFIPIFVGQSIKGIMI